MKNILGLDLGTNSIGWALIDNDDKRIVGMGSRIIPMGTDKQDYERGVGITKNADRRTARTIRKMNKRFKMRRNKLLFILNELGMLPDQFKFKNSIPPATKLQELELLPIKKGTLQLDSTQQYELRVKAFNNKIDLKEFGKILYQFNQLRGYAGGNHVDENITNKSFDSSEEETEKKTYEVITKKVFIKEVEKTDGTFKSKGGPNKGQELPIFNITIVFEDEEKEGTTFLQNLETGKEEELEIRIKQTKKGENIIFALPQKTNWRKNMEEDEDTLKKNNWTIGQYRLNDLKEIKWKKIRNRVFLRKQYQKEFDIIWNEQEKHHSLLNNCPKEKLFIIANYLYPGTKESQTKLRNQAIEGGLFHIIRNQVIYYQRPLKPQTELISNCSFEKDQKVLPESHPLFQEFRCWKQINNMFITSKVESYNERNKKTNYKYYDRYLTNEQKNELYLKLHSQKQVGFAEVSKIVALKNDRTEYLNGLNPKAKLKGCDTKLSIKQCLGEWYEALNNEDSHILEKIWYVLYNTTGNEYDERSEKVSTLIKVLEIFIKRSDAVEFSLKLAQKINYPRKYCKFSAKAIENILPLMMLNPKNIHSTVLCEYDKIKYIIETGDVTDNVNIEPYMIDYINNNPNIIETGGMMDSFAISLVYGRHTADIIKPTITTYHQIQYNPTRNLRNPVVEQLSNEIMQVIKSIWKQYNLNPKDLEIRVELARELKNSAAEREKIYKSQRTNQTHNEWIKNRMHEHKIPITDENILKYKLYEQQKYISPYSGATLTVCSFDKYEIDHIIPKSRLFDDSISNKVLVEGFLNEEKSNRTSWEYITHQTTNYKIYSVESYLKTVNEKFCGKKKRNLLLEKIPTDFIERQIKETQYISVAVRNELAKIVGSTNVKTTTGEVTSFLRSSWGLKKLFMELTEERFKQMELWDNSKQWVKKYYDKEQNKNIYEIEHWSKRYDHRHHSIDALVVALTDQGHIQRLNNLNKELQDWLIKHKDEIKLDVNEGETFIEAFFNLEENRRITIQKKIEGFRKFENPFDDLVKQAKEKLETMIVSHKPKDSLSIQYNIKTKKKELKIRGALHEATLYGKHNGQDTKTINISNLTPKDILKIVDKGKSVLKKEIENHWKKYDSMKEAFSGEGLKNFNNERGANNKPPVYKVKVYYNNKEVIESSLQRLYENNDKLSVKTGGNYLFIVMNKTNKDGVEERVYDSVSLFDSAQIAKEEWKNKNENFVQKILDLRLKEKNAFEVLFTLQQNELVYMPENIEDPVLNITSQEFKDWLSVIENKVLFAKRIYKVVKFSGNDCYFIPNSYANTIEIPRDFAEEEILELKKKYGEKKLPNKEKNFVEFGSNGNSSKFIVNEDYVKSLKDKNYKYNPIKIIDHCIKLKNDWLGNITEVNGKKINFQ